MLVLRYRLGETGESDVFTAFVLGQVVQLRLAIKLSDVVPLRVMTIVGRVVGPRDVLPVGTFSLHRKGENSFELPDVPIGDGIARVSLFLTGIPEGVANEWTRLTHP